jgi:beta-lactamase regulating signal transducer with metallopeptidase domain
MTAIASALSFALLHSLWQGALLAFGAWLTLRAMPRAEAALRHAVSMAFLVAMALAPLAQLLIFASADAPLDSGPLSRMLDGRFAEIAAPLTAGVWMAGAAFMLSRGIAAQYALFAMERAHGLAAPPAWLERSERLRRAMGVAATIAVRLSDRVLVPCVTHVIRPTIWLPASLLTRMSAEQLEALLAHELAHVARKDWLWNGLQTFIEALMFYHPAVWWLGKRIRQEREHACDDLAVRGCGDAVVLAEALAELECARRTAPSLSLAANGGVLLQRVTRLLTPPPAHGAGRIVMLLGALAMFGALAAGQVGAGGGQAHAVHVQSSTTGALGPGDYLQVTTNEDNTQRFYRASIDARGQFTEVYRVNGREAPIDADVRAWLVSVGN